MKNPLYLFFSLWYLVFIILWYQERKAISHIESKISYHKVYYLSEIKKFDIRRKIEIGLRDKNRKWSVEKIDRLTDVIFVGWKEYDIPYEMVLTIISIESRYKIHVKSWNYEDNFDYGLTQINSENIKRLSRVSSRVLKKYNIEHDPKNQFDIALNVMNCFSYLDWSRSHLIKKKKFIKKRWVQSYNVGIAGLRLKRFKKSRELYWEKYLDKEKIYLEGQTI